MLRWFLAACCGLAISISADAGNPAPSQVFYVPFPENDQLAGYIGVNSVAVDPLAVFVSFSASADNTVIYYDHWEDGYEEDITRPKQSTTLIFGDGAPANGYPPGNAGDLISAGTVFSLRNYVTSINLQAVLDYDARDKIASFKPISVTKTSFPASTDSLLAGCVEVFERGLWGTEYRVPVGSNMPTSTATATLTWDADIFAYSALSIMAGAGGAMVQIDADNNGAFEQTVLLGEGQTSYVTGVRVGGRVLSDKPVQVVLFTGRPTSNYQSRDTSLLPVNRWSTSYYAPVSTPAANGTSVFLYNPGTSAITVSYAYRSSASGYVTATVNVPAGGNTRVTLTASNGTNHFGAYRFYTTGATPPVFYAFCAVDAASNSTGNNQAYDGGFTLVGQPSLTTQVLVSLGIGRDPYSGTNPAENGNPVWITTAGNGHVAETVYVDFNGDNAGALTDPNGNHFDVSYSLRELQQLKLLDPDGDQSAMLVYVLNPNVKIAAAWAQDPAVAAAGQPGLDVSTLIPPLREGDASKGSTVTIDADGDGYRSAGDTLEYDIRTINTARTGINGPFTIQDVLPADVTYIAGSTKYRFSVGGAWQAWVAVPDDGGGTAFPLDVSGFAVPGTLGAGQQIQVVFHAVIKTYPNLTPGTARIINTGNVVVTPYGITVGLEWSDLIYGSIGDRVWVDADGNGTQDGGETGLNGVTVYADGNNNGVRDAGEVHSISSGDGSYLLSGLLAGNYIIRVDPASVAALNPGYGLTHDLDGIATSYVAAVTLAAAQDRTDVDFGFRVGASVGDRVWIDRDGDGAQEAGEPGINGVRVFIDTNGNSTYQVGEPNAITFGDGSYYIGNLNSGTYSVCIDTATLPGGTTQTFDSDGTATANRSVVNLAGAQHRADLDFGYRGTLSIGDLVWNDVDASGTNNSESGIANVRVYVDGNGNGVWDGTEAYATSNSSGIYSITNLFNGTYTVRVDQATLPNSMAQTHDLASPTTDHQATVTLSGASRTDVDFGYRDDATIGDRVWNDMDNDGAQDVGEPGIEGVLVYIDANGDNVFDQGVERFAITDANGGYVFNNLVAGIHAVRVEISTLPRGSTQTYDLDGLGSGHEASRTLTVSQNATDVDFGYRSTSSVGNFVWLDENADGIQDPGEEGIDDVRVYLDINGNGVMDSASEPSAITAGNGAYTIGGLVAGAYTARVDTGTLPVGMISTHDLAGDLDNAATFMLAPSQIRTDVDFGYTQPVTVGDRVWHDLNANGVQDAGEPGVDGVVMTVFNAGTNTISGATVTSGGGNYAFGSLLAGTYHVEFGALPGYSRSLSDQGSDDAKDSDANPLTGRTADVTLTSGQGNLTLDAGYYQSGAISGTVLADVDGDGDGDIPLAGVVVRLLDGLGNPVPDAYGDPVTATTGADGAYGFGILNPGNYRVVQNQPNNHQSVSDTDGANDNIIGNVTPITVISGNNNSGNDFIEIELGAISGHVYSGSTPLAGVTVTLLDESGNPVDGDPDTPGVQPVSTVTSPTGYYQFIGIVPGIYQVAQTQPAGYDSSADPDGGNLDIIGDVTPITIGPGQHSQNNNFIEALDTCPDDWAEWKFQHPGEEADGNPDADAYDNFAEFAFAMPAENGTGSSWLGNTAWIIRPSSIASGTLEGVFVRPKGAPLNVTYTLQHAAVPGDPTVWQSIAITPSISTTEDNGDCTETVTIHDLEATTGLTGGSGIVRIKVDLDNDPPTGTDHTSYAEVQGWKETPLEPCCRTYNNPFLRETIFSGTVSGVSGQNLEFAISGGGVDPASLLAGGSFYLEVTSGDNEGHRFDIVSGSGNSVVLANDSSLHSAAAPFNTLNGPPPGSLAGDQVAIRRHWTLGEIFPTTGLGASGSQSTADQVQVFAGGTWTIYWLYDLNDGDPATASWVDSSDAGMADQGNVVIPSGQGVFFNNRTTSNPILSYGEVRPNDFIRPLAAGLNLVGGGHPLDQSAAGARGRSMNIAAGFFGSRDFKTADSFFLWNADATIGTGGYSTFFLLNGAPSQPALLRWVKTGDASLAIRDAEIRFLGNRSVFLRSKAEIPDYTIPSPWKP